MNGSASSASIRGTIIGWIVTRVIIPTTTITRGVSKEEMGDLMAMEKIGLMVTMEVGCHFGHQAVGGGEGGIMAMMIGGLLVGVEEGGDSGTKPAAESNCDKTR